MSTDKPIAPDVPFRKAFAGKVMLLATALDDPSHLIRVYPDECSAYDQMIAVTELDGGAELFLSGWIGPPLSLSQWRTAKAELFPGASRVSWMRRRKDGSFHLARFPV